MIEDGWRVRIFTSGRSWLPRRSTILGVPATRWPMPFADGGRLQRLWFAGTLVAHLAAHPFRYGAVHLHGQPSVLRVLRYAKRLLRIKVVYKATMDGGDDPARLIGQQGASLIDTVDRWVCISTPMAVGALEAGVEEGSIWRAPNGVDLSGFSPLPEPERARAREELGVPDGTTLWLSVAAVIPRKRLDLLIEAWGNLRGTGHTLLIAGPTNFEPHTGVPLTTESPYVASLLSMIEERQLGDQVRLLGNRDDVPRLLGAADGFAFASAREGMPNAVVEALACGLPIVMTRLPAGEDLKVIAEDRLTIVDESPKAIADAVLRAPTSTRSIPANLLEVSLDRVARGYTPRYEGLGLSRC